MNPALFALQAPPAPPVHPRLRTAFTVLGYCESVSAGRRRGGEPRGRDLVAGEVAARNAALELIRHYLSGEIELDPAAPPSPPDAAWPFDPGASPHAAMAAAAQLPAPEPDAPGSGAGPATDACPPGASSPPSAPNDHTNPPAA